MTYYKKYDTIISKSYDIGQTDLIKMHIATRLNAVPISAQPYPLALRYHDFSKQEIKNFLDAGIIHKSICPWACPIVVVKNTHTRRHESAVYLCIDYRKLNSLLPAATPAMGTKKGAFTHMPLPKINELFALLKGVRYFTALDP